MVKLLEQKYKTDTPWVLYTKKDEKENDDFMKKYIHPLDKEVEEWKFNPTWGNYLLFMMAYLELPDNVKENLKKTYIEYRVLYFKKKISNILEKKYNNGTFKVNRICIQQLAEIIWYDKTNEFLKELKKSQ